MKICSLLPLSVLLLTVLHLPSRTLAAGCECSPDENSDRDKSKSLPLKIIAIFSILAGGFAGVFVPILGRWVPALRPERDAFFVVKAFAAGVILATGFIHILPDAYESLTSPCLAESPWQDFPFTGLVAMAAAIGTLMLDSFATGYYSRLHFRKVRGNADGQDGASPSNADGGDRREEESVGHVHGSHGHGHANDQMMDRQLKANELIRRRVVSQVKKGLK